MAESAKYDERGQRTIGFLLNMSGSHRRDRGALLALGMALIAIVLVAWITSNGPVTDTRSFDPWRDSYAQWSMAILSVAATGLSAYAVLLIRDTLKETRSAVRAADDAVVATRDIGEKQVRAYLSVSAVSFLAPDKSDRCYIQVAIRNSGQSPALNTKIICNVQITYGGATTATTISLRAGDIEAGSERVEPLLLEVRNFSFREVSQREVMLLADGDITFSDVFDANHQIAFGSFVYVGMGSEFKGVVPLKQFRTWESSPTV